MRRAARGGLLLAAAMAVIAYQLTPEMPRFQNNHDHSVHGLRDLLRWQLDLPNRSFERRSFPLADNDPAALAANRSAPTLTWVGHATVLLQYAGMNILTDPHFTDWASPLSGVGPRRLTAPGLALQDLPHIDIVVISHNHYDHLDLPTLEALVHQQSDQPPRIYVPAKLGDWLARQSIAVAAQLDWWEDVDDAGWRVHAVPVQHFSARTPFDRNATLWSGWVLEHSDGFRFFFAGDTGYTPDFAEIGRRFGSIDLAAIPIGAYEPRWFMKPMHMNPEEAVQAHIDVRAKQSVAIHWGTFRLTDEPLAEPPQRLATARAAAGLAEEAFLVLRHGETVALKTRNSSL